MVKRPYVLIKSALSIDGYLDDMNVERLILSNDIDFQKVDMERAKCDAILLGAETIRKDNPKCLIKSSELKKNRLKKGMTEDIIKISITNSGDFNNNYNYFKTGTAKKYIYCNQENVEKILELEDELVEVIPFSDNWVNPILFLNDLYLKGIKKLIVEGGRKINTMFLSQGLVDEVQISIAPFFVGNSAAPRFTNDCQFPFNKDNRMNLESVDKFGDMVMITYKL